MMKHFSLLALLLTILMTCAPAHAVELAPAISQKTVQEPQIRYAIETVPLERAGQGLYLQKLQVAGDVPDKQILLVHGLTYSSHEFDVNVGDYSLARYLARQGYAVWTVDIAGYGQSQPVQNGFMPDSAYAAQDIASAVDKIIAVSGQDKIDLLGWSWGTVTSALFTIQHPDKVKKLVLYAPILTGLGQADVAKPFNHNTWVHAAGDFQTALNGEIDYAITDQAVVNAFQSNSWRYDQDSSPNGGRRDLLVDKNKILIPFDKIRVPTFVIGGDKDPYLNLPMLEKEITKLPEGSKFAIIPGAAHAMMMEKPYYKQFRQQVAEFFK